VKLLSVGSDEPGVFAFGQYATGIVAVGQISVGVIAIGQVARGVVAVGQVAVGVVALGQVSAGASYAVGMLGVAARGRGLVLRLFPKVESIPPRPAPPPVAPEGVLAGRDPEAWIAVERRGDGLFVAGTKTAIDTTSVGGSMREAAALGEEIGVARVVGTAAGGGASDYRSAATPTITLAARQIALNRRRGWRMVAWLGEKNIGTAELVGRFALTALWGAAVVGVIAWSLAALLE